MQLILTASDPAQTSLTVVDGTTDTGMRLLAGAEWGNAAWDQKFSGPRGTQGARMAGAAPQNRPVVLPIRIYGSSMDNLMARFATLATIGRLMLRYGGTIRWQANSQTRRQHFTVLAAGVQRETWGKRAESSLIVDVSFQAVCAPFLLGDPLDIRDEFSTDSIADYTFSVGGGTMSVSGGQLAPSSTAEKRFLHTGLGYTHRDAQVTLKVIPGASAAAGAVQLMLRCDSGWNTGVMGNFQAPGTMEVYKLTGGSFTGLTVTSTGSFTPAAGTPYWARFRAEDRVLTAEFFTVPPTPGSTPAATRTAVLSASEDTAIPDGMAGARIVSLPATDWRFDDLAVEPYTYRARTLPEAFALGGSIPGDAPAVADAIITPSGGSAAPAWAWLAWSERPQTWNACWNGDFEEDTNGWSVAAVTGVTGAATSITRVTTAAKVKHGLAAGDIQTPATANTGASFAMYGRFRKGVTYTAELWAYSAAATTNTRIRLGVNGDIASETAAPLSATLTRRTVAWTPAADVNVAYVAFEVTAATSTLMAIDGVMVYEGTTAPALASQAEGRGAFPPFGLIDAIACDTGDLTTWAAVTDANYRSGSGIRRATSGAETPSATWFVDPHTLTPDDFARGELDVEVFARIEVASTVVSPRLTLSTTPEAGTTYGPQRYTAEYGSAGKLLKLPSSGTVFRVVRLGTLTLLADRQRPARWKVKLAASYAAGSTGSFGVDYLVLAPARARACGPTGKALDATYPKFTQSTSETRRTIRSDLSGRTGNPASYSLHDHPAAGLGGSLLELPAGQADVAVKLSSLVPDDPSSDTTTEQLSHTATVHLAIVPRYHLARAS